MIEMVFHSTLSALTKIWHTYR